MNTTESLYNRRKIIYRLMVVHCTEVQVHICTRYNVWVPIDEEWLMLKYTTTPLLHETYSIVYIYCKQKCTLWCKIKLAYTSYLSVGGFAKANNWWKINCRLLFLEIVLKQQSMVVIYFSKFSVPVKFNNIFPINMYTHKFTVCW